MTDMNKRLICLTGLLVLAVAAAFVGSAQEVAVMTNGAVVLNNTTSNVTSNATFNESVIAPTEPATLAQTNDTMASPLDMSSAVADQDDTMPAENETAPAENLTSAESIAPIAAADNAGAMPGPMALGGSNLITKPGKPIYAIGAAASTPGIFPIGKEYLPDQAFNAGMSAETIMDLSALPFYINHM